MPSAFSANGGVPQTRQHKFSRHTLATSLHLQFCVRKKQCRMVCVEKLLELQVQELGKRGGAVLGVVEDIPTASHSPKGE
jgi:hypothetical protein